MWLLTELITFLPCVYYSEYKKMIYHPKWMIGCIQCRKIDRKNVHSFIGRAHTQHQPFNIITIKCCFMIRVTGVWDNPHNKHVTNSSCSSSSSDSSYVCVHWWLYAFLIENESKLQTGFGCKDWQDSLLFMGFSRQIILLPSIPVCRVPNCVRFSFHLQNNHSKLV